MGTPTILEHFELIDQLRTCGSRRTRTVVVGLLCLERLGNSALDTSFAPPHTRSRSRRRKFRVSGHLVRRPPASSFSLSLQTP